MSDNKPLSPQVIKGLQDRMYEKRKAAAIEVDKLIHSLMSMKDTEGIRRIIRFLIDEFAYSPASNMRNGGLIGLAATAIALGPVCHVSGGLGVCEESYGISRGSETPVLVCCLEST